MKINFEKNKEQIILVPEDEWDVFNLGKIMMKIDGVSVEFMTNENEKTIVKKMMISKNDLLNYLLLSKKE